MRRESLARRRLPVLSGIVLTIFLILSGLQYQGMGHWLQRLDYLLYDWRFQAGLQWQPQAPGEQPIIIVDIDERSLAAEGRWPWSRHKLAELLSLLSSYGAAVVAFDVVFSEAERNPIDDIRSRLAADGTDWQSPAGWRRQVDADLHFARTLAQTDTVLGFFFLDDDRHTTGQLPAAVYHLTAVQQQTLVVSGSRAYAANLAELQDAAAGGGFVTTYADDDGAIRRTPLLIRYGPDLYPSLGLATVMAFLLDARLQPDTVPVGRVEAVRSLQLAQLQVRTDAAARVIVPYRGSRKTFPYVSAGDVFNGRADVALFAGAIVLVGTSAQGLGDLRATPAGPQYPGVEIHATVIDAMLNDGFPYRPEWEAGATMTLLLVLGLLLSFRLPRLEAAAVILLSGSAVLLVLGGNFWLWQVYRLDLPLAAALLLVSGLTILNLAHGFVRENSYRHTLKSMFDQYVPPAHIERMLDDPQAYQFAGESKELTVLFSDIRGFTTISERLPAAELTELLNRYFTPVTGVIFTHDGTIDKYVGDMVMAFWGAPLDDCDHARHAVQAALAIQQVTTELRAEFRARGWPEIETGIGINTGVMSVGDMGSAYRRAYTVLGDAVNLGSRLESITRYYGVDILVSEHTRAQAPDFVYRFVDRIQVKGKNTAVSVYEPLCHRGEEDSELLEEIALFAEVYRLYLGRDWAAALRLLLQLQQRWPSALYQVYLQRIDQLRRQSLPADWDGVFRHHEK